MYRDIPEDMRRLVEPIVESAGFELVDLLHARGRGPGLLRVTIDTPAGDGRVPVERCADVSREIESALDAADAVSGAYRLEVSSPGLDRPLAREKDFSVACGREVELETRSPRAGRRRFRGRLLSFESGTARLELEGDPVEIPFDEVVRGRVVYEFTRADFAPAAGPR